MPHRPTGVRDNKFLEANPKLSFPEDSRSRGERRKLTRKWRRKRTLYSTNGYSFEAAMTCRMPINPGAHGERREIAAGPSRLIRGTDR